MFGGTKVALLIAAGIAGLHADGALAQARVEYLAFQSMTLSDTAFLNGRKDGPSVALAGELRMPRLGEARLPTVVMLHGSGGVGGAGGPITELSRALNGLGIATFAVDAFSGRGLVSTGADQSQLGRLAMIVDAYRALEVVAKHRQVDRNRIALMGFSRGGQSALYASIRRFQDIHAAGNTRFAAFLPFYPACVESYRNDEDVTAPIRVFHGAADDYNPVAACRPYLDRLIKAGRDVKLNEYAGAHHVFDGPGTPKLIKSPQSQTTRGCRLAENDKGEMINGATQEPFSYKDACVERGVTIGFDEDAYKASHAEVREYLTGLFALKQ